MSKIKVAVIGYGHLGKWHAQKVHLHPDAQLHSIVEPNPINQEQARKQYPECSIVNEIDEIINEIDAALVVTPTSTHYEIIKKLAQFNIHIFCEKPLCSTDQQAQEIQDIMNQRSSLLQVGHSERFHNAWKYIQEHDYYKKFLEEIGTLRISRLAPFKGRATDVDVVSDLMVHDIDLLVFLFNEKPFEVSSTGYKIRTSNWDYVCSEFHFKSGRRAIVTVGRNHIKEIRELEYTSPHGCMYIDMFKNEILVAPSGQIHHPEKKVSDFVESIPYEKEDHLYVEQDHFYRSIIEKKQAIVSALDGVLAVNMISKVLKSLETGETQSI